MRGCCCTPHQALNSEPVVSLGATGLREWSTFGMQYLSRKLLMPVVLVDPTATSDCASHFSTPGVPAVLSPGVNVKSLPPSRQPIVGMPGEEGVPSLVGMHSGMSHQYLVMLPSLEYFTIVEAHLP